jgi:hypothetical protein
MVTPMIAISNAFMRRRLEIVRKLPHQLAPELWTMQQRWKVACSEFVTTDQVNLKTLTVIEAAEALISV